MGSLKRISDDSKRVVVAIVMSGFDGTTVVVSSGAEIVAKMLFELATMLPELVAGIVSDRVVLIINELDELEQIVLEVDKIDVVLDVLTLDEDEGDDECGDGDEEGDDDDDDEVEVEVGDEVEVVKVELARSDELAALV